MGEKCGKKCRQNNEKSPAGAQDFFRFRRDLSKSGLTMPSDVPFCLGEQKDPCILPVLKELNVIQMNLLERDFLEGCPFLRKNLKPV